jgi:glutamate racemase
MSGGNSGGNLEEIMIGVPSKQDIKRLLKNSTRIGLFDSGVGGLSVLKELHGYAASSHQNMEFVYVGDTARCPYGNRDAHEIKRFVEEIVSWLNEQAVDAIIMACNTSAALALNAAREVSSVPVIDLIGATASYVAAQSTKVGVMATASTVRSRAFSNAIQRLNPDIEVVEIACPDLVPIVEEGKSNHPHALEAVRKYTDAMKREKVDALILGCTHFPFLYRQIQSQLSDSVLLIDPATTLISNEEDILKRFISSVECARHSIDVAFDVSYNSEIYVTGRTDSFERAASACLGAEVTSVRNLSMEHFETALAKLLRPIDEMPAAVANLSVATQMS